MTLAVYPGTFDPMTLGHVDLVRRAARLFDRVIVAVAASPAKRPLFDLDERIALAQGVLDDLPQVSVMGFDGLLVDFVQAQQAQVVVRGIRSVSDYEYEQQLAALNQSLLPALEYVFLTSPPTLSFLASSLVREVASLGGDVSQWVHPGIEDALNNKYGQVTSR